MKTGITKIGWLLVVSIVSAASVAVAENKVTADLHQYYPFPGHHDAGTITNIGPATGNWNIPAASASAYTDYGINQISLSCFFDGGVLAPYQDGVNNLASDWTDSLIITGGSGTNNAVFRFNIRSDVGDGFSGYLFWDIGLNDYSAGGILPNNINRNGTWDFSVQYVYDQPFVVHAATSAYCQASNVHALVELRLSNILLPPGATIGSASGVDWNTKTAVTSPSLGISPSGTNVLLHWLAFSDYILETTTNLSSGAAWIQVTDYAPVVNGAIEYTLSHPMDVPVRFFRLRQLIP